MTSNHPSLIEAPLCPACENGLGADADFCPHCGLTLNALDSLFGAVPVHRGKINDHVAVFTGKDLSRLAALLRQMHERFPQSTFTIFTTKLVNDYPLSCQAFWLFNRARICAPASKYGKNFSALLLIAPHRFEASLTVGYGLERLFSGEDLQACLEAGRKDLSFGEFGRGCLKIFASLSDRMRDVANRERRRK